MLLTWKMEMKIIRIILILLGFQMGNVYGSSPEFYGIYANNNNKLIEMAESDKNRPPYDFGQNVQFLVFQKRAEMYANGLTIERAIFVRTVNNPGMDGKQPPKNVNTWKPRRDGVVSTRTKPVAGQPEQIYVVPRSPLPAGMYIVSVKGGGGELGKFYVDKNQVTQNLERGKDCIDIVVGSGWASYEYDLNGGGGKVMPCSNSPTTTSGSNAISSMTTTGAVTSQIGVMIRIPGRNYEIGKTEVTQAEWRAVMGNNPSKFSRCGDTCPVEQVSWGEAQTFIQKLNAKTGKQYRLPTEAEWEYACHGGSRSEYCGGNDLNAVAWYGNNGQPGGNSGQTTHPAGQKQANGYGLYDMSGNVREWTDDCYNVDCAKRVLRGGSWADIAINSRSAFRFGVVPGSTFSGSGFRIARTLP